MQKSLLGRQMIDYKCLSTAGELDSFPLDCCNSLMVGTKKGSTQVPQMCCLNDKLKQQQIRPFFKESKSRVERPINKDKDRQLSKNIEVFPHLLQETLNVLENRRCSFSKKKQVAGVGTTQIFGEKIAKKIRLKGYFFTTPYQCFTHVITP